MAKTDIKEFEIPIKKLKIPLDEFLQKLDNQDDVFDNYSIISTVVYDDDDQATHVRVKLVNYFHGGLLWFIASFFTKNVELDTDVRELEI